MSFETSASGFDRSFQTDTRAKLERPEDGIASDASGPALLAEPEQAPRAGGAPARLGARAARRRRLSGGDGRLVLRERASQGAVRPLGRAGGRVDARRGLWARGRRASAARPGSARPATRPREARRSPSSSASCAGSKATAGERDTSASSSWSRRTGASCAERGRSRGGSPTSRAGRRGSATTRSSSPTARSEPSPSSETTGSRATPTGPARRKTCYARPEGSATSRFRCEESHQLISAPKTITFAIT